MDWQRLLKSRRLKNIFKLSLIAVLLYFLAQKGFLSLEKTQSALTQWKIVVPAFLFMTISTFITIFRWHILLRAQEIRLPFLRTAQLGFIGFFFNIALPGVVSGDVIKAIYVAKEAQGKRAEAFGSILFDRFCGVSGLVFVSTGALLLSLGSQTGNKLFEALSFFVIAAGIGVLGFYIYLFAIKESFDPLLRLFEFLEKRRPFFGSLTRIYQGIKNYREKRSLILITLLSSVILHICVVFACVHFAWALGAHDVSVLSLFVVIPLGLLVTAIPLSPGGVGTGHAAFLALFHLLGSERGADVFNLFLLYQLCLGATGAIIYARFKGKTPVITEVKAEA